ncbi:GPW/gp25 family protein [Agrobacterium tumefaciens]|nr:GPW/gp25 family protein [Agrobacterium tumefaciens]NTE21023.1 GPW/gp25 family protein [Agrobacterium tumefaciens]
MDKLTKYEHSFLGSGWAFPVTFSAGNSQLVLSANEQNINSSIDIILMTKQGERYFDPQFGSGLQQFFFKKMDETLRGEIAEAIKISLLHNEPRITVFDVKVEFTDLYKGLTEITILYTYNQTNTRHNYVFPFHINEGTSLTV